MSKIDIQKMDLDPKNCKISNIYLEIRTMLNELLGFCTKMNYGLKHRIFESFGELFYENPLILDKLQIPIKDFLYLWPDPKYGTQIDELTEKWKKWKKDI